MSIKRMVAVWEGSDQAGNSLLLLLALADHADDIGVCWPGLDRLSRRTRVSRRTITRLIGELGDNGEVWILERPGRTCIYIVTVGLTRAELAEGQAKAEKMGAVNTRGSVKLSPPPQVLDIVKGQANLSTPPKGVETQLCPGGQDISEGVKTQLCPGGQDTAMSPDPSLTVNKDPSEEPSISPSLLWTDTILPTIQQGVPKGTFDTYYRGSEVVKADNGTWTVQVRDGYAAEFMNHRQRPTIERIAGAHAPGVRLEFVARG